MVLKVIINALKTKLKNTNIKHQIHLTVIYNFDHITTDSVEITLVIENSNHLNKTELIIYYIIEKN